MLSKRTVAMPAVALLVLGQVVSARADQSPPSSARNIVLCHHEEAGAVCDTSVRDHGMDTLHDFTAQVLDAAGSPVPDVPVAFTETGPATFPEGGNASLVTTDADGIARVVLHSQVEGTSEVVAEISPVGTPGGFRGPGPDDDECEQPAGPGGAPPAGNCVAGLTLTWSTHPGPACSDGHDNDGDGAVDEDDLQCADGSDDSEDDSAVSHTRSVGFRFDDGPAHSPQLLVFGRLRVPDGFHSCAADQQIVVVRRSHGKWVHLRTQETNSRGRFAVEVFDEAARYRVIAPRSVAGPEEAPCLRAVKEKRHRHRR